MNPKVDDFIENTKQWKDEYIIMRKIVLDCGLIEELKWGQPCYTFQNSNIIILGGFKDNCIISFLKGALLNDADNLLVKAGQNTQSARVIRFTNVQQIIDLAVTIKTYIFEAIEVEKAGLKIEKSKEKLLLAEELKEKMNQDKAFKTAFEKLTPGRQRAYNMFISEAKQSSTRVTRIEKYIPRILAGKGINDCICGKSKRMPNCDGSHKFI